MKQPCGCCAGIEVATPQTEYNRPGLPALTYRAGTYATFFETMLARLSNLSIDAAADDGSGSTTHLTPLKNLTTRNLNDPSIALLDAWSVVGDILTFYQERIANEGYLGTAIEHRSVLELARLVGYRLRPGVSASVYLAFTVANGFEGVIPAGTRAQSVPLAGQNPQFFETSDDLNAQDTWNAMTPRLTRPQIITPPPAKGVINHLGTNAGVLDSMFVNGVANNLKPGDPLLITFGDGPEQQVLRFADAVDLEAADSRTRVALQEDWVNIETIDAIQRFIDDSTNAFDGSDLAAQAASLLGSVIAQSDGTWSVTGSLPSIIPGIRTLQAVAVKRNFVRLEIWFDHLLQMLRDAGSGQAVVTTFAGNAVQPSLTNYAVSSLTQLQNLVKPLAAPASVPPANSLLLARSVKTSFTPQSDLVARLTGVLNSIPSKSVYSAWSSSEPNPLQLQVFAARAKAQLFAATFAGASAYTPPTGNETMGQTSFTLPSIGNAWNGLLREGEASLSVIALDATYDQIKRGSWVAIDTPSLGKPRTYAKVTATTTRTLNTTTGFAAKVTILTLDREWVSAANDKAFIELLGKSDLLRETIVYAQTEELDLAEEPLDRDVEGGSIELDGLYDGLETGQWVILTGTRTDVPNVTGLTGAELLMISGITQGKGKGSCYPFLPNFIPLTTFAFLTDADINGDRLVVGVPAGNLATVLQTIPEPSSSNQEFCEPLQIAPGLYANAYVPTAGERLGQFPTFSAQLAILKSITLSPGGSLFAWRIASIASGAETVHTTLEFASPLSYKYDSTTVSVCGNVAKATHGQSTGEVLGNGNASQAFQTFALSQSPLTYLPAATPFGAASTLTVAVNEIEWNEADDLSGLAPSDHDYTTQTGDAGDVSVVFGDGNHGALVPTGNSNIKATYRYGTGSVGNVDAGQISQLSSRPLGLQAVVNPLPASGGADADSVDQARANTPTAVLALDRLVSVQDYADFARTFAGIAKSSSTKISDGRQQIVHLTVAGNGDITIDPSSDLYQALVAALALYGDPYEPFYVASRREKLLIVAAQVALLPDYEWLSVAPQINAAMFDYFSFDQRDLGQTAYLSEAISVMQNVEGVSYVNITTFDAAGDETQVAQLAQLGSKLKLRQRVDALPARINLQSSPGDDPSTRIIPAQLVYLSSEIPDTLMITQVGA